MVENMVFFTDEQIQVLKEVAGIFEKDKDEIIEKWVSKQDQN